MYEILKKWLLRDYEQSKSYIERDVVARFSRGNVLVQQMKYIDESQFDELTRKGDASISRLRASLSGA